MKNHLSAAYTLHVVCTTPQRTVHEDMGPHSHAAPLPPPTLMPLTPKNGLKVLGTASYEIKLFTTTPCRRRRTPQCSHPTSHPEPARPTPVSWVPLGPIPMAAAPSSEMGRPAKQPSPYHTSCWQMWPPVLWLPTPWLPLLWPPFLCMRFGEQGPGKLHAKFGGPEEIYPAAAGGAI